MSCNTQHTKEWIKRNIDILQTIADVCDTYSNGNMSWNQVCCKKGIDPVKTRNLILNNLDKCIGNTKPLGNLTFDIYDGYENFYRSVFGDSTLKQAALPFDYKKSVLHVIKNTGLDEREADVLLRRFGIDDHETMTLEQIGREFCITGNRVRQIEAKALRKCRCMPRISILKNGLSEYNLSEKQAEEQNQQRLEYKKLEHDALMAKNEDDHKKRMEIIVSD